ncbi:hypothetical protein [Ralstonia solanacearum]|nr:hypothetical protein [Ralstonia solanacearum]
MYAGSIPTPASKMREKALMIQGFFIFAAGAALDRAAWGHLPHFHLPPH